MQKYKEMFKIIKDYDYEISNYGNVKNSITGNIIKPTTVNMRSSVKLYKVVEGEKYKQFDVFYVDELVCTYFLRQYDGEFIYHKDKNRHNCNVGNLSFNKKAENYKYYVYFETKEGFRVYDNFTGEIFDMDKLPRDANKFHLFDEYENTDKSLKEFAKDFKIWCDELSNNEIFKIKYQRYGTHFMAVQSIFKMLCEHYETMKPITMYENEIMNKTFNSGLVSLDPKYENKVVMSYGVDFSANYPTILQSEEFKIPTCAPIETILNKLPKMEDVELGIYHVIISSNNQDFKNNFSFSKNNHYSDISLKFAMEHKSEFNISINLVQDNQTNAYIYKEFVTGRSVFGKWFDTLIKLKNAFPKNRLLKHLMASVWGMITHPNIINKTFDEMERDNIKIGEDYDIYEIKHCGSKKEYYELIPLNKNLYEFNIRIKPFLTSYARVNIANVILDGDNRNYFIRACVDNAVFTRPIDYTKFKGLSPELKTSGLIHWIKCNRYNSLFKQVNINFKDGLKIIDEYDKV